MEEEVYVEQPQGYDVLGQKHKVYMLKRELYGLNQAPRAWYNQIDFYLTKNGSHRSESEPKLYTKVNEQGKMLIVCLYVDDLIFVGDYGIAYFKAVMESEFEMTDLGLMNIFLGIEVQQSESRIFISQKSMQLKF